MTHKPQKLALQNDAIRILLERQDTSSGEKKGCVNMVISMKTDD